MSEPTYRIAQALHERRAAVGLPKYGQHLTADSPGCMLVHALEESADKTNYLIAEVQRRREAIKALCDLIHGGTLPDHKIDTVAEISYVIDLLGGEAALAKYDEILGTVANDATVAPEPRDSTLDTVEMALRNIHAGANNHYFVKDNAGAGLEALGRYKDKLCGAAPDPRDEALRVAEKAMADELDRMKYDKKHRSHKDYAEVSVDELDERMGFMDAALAAIRGAR